MMKKIAALLICALMLLSLTACSGSQPQTQPATTTAQATTPNPVEEYADLLPFLKDGEIYFDIHVTDAVKNLAVKLDGKAVDAASKKTTFTKDSQLSFEGEASADKSLTMYLVFGTKDETATTIQYRYSQSIHRGMDADKALERLPQVLSSILGGNAKILVILTEDPGTWDTSLSEKLNEFLKPYTGK